MIAAAAWMDTMLLKQMLEAPVTSSKLVVYDALRPFDRESLLKEVVGLANARVDGPRNILFGVNPGALNGNAVVGIPDSAIGELKRAHRLVSSLVEPVLDLAFIFDRINGKLVGALEIDGCEYGPYFLAQDLTDELHRGACWIREERDLLAIERHELLNGHAAATEGTVLDVSPDDVSLFVGFNDEPECEFIEVTVPDTSDPPFAEEEGVTNDGTEMSTNFAQALKDTVGTVTTQILRMAGQERSSDDDSDNTQSVGVQVAEAARKHYFYEERAVKVELCIRNEGDVDLEDLHVEIGFPRLPGFDVADQIYTSPFDKRSAAEIKKLGYPAVKHKDDAIIVKTTLDTLLTDSTHPLFGTPLRFAVGPEALGRKLGMQYVLRRADGLRLGNGRLKVRLGRKPVKESGNGAAKTHYQSLDDE